MQALPADGMGVEVSRYVIIQCEQRVTITRQCARSLTFEDWEDEDDYLETYNWKRTEGGAYFCHEHPRAYGKNSAVEPTGVY